jgi:hypothetical protein
MSHNHVRFDFKQILNIDGNVCVWYECDTKRPVKFTEDLVWLIFSIVNGVFSSFFPFRESNVFTRVWKVVNIIYSNFKKVYLQLVIMRYWKIKKKNPKNLQGILSLQKQPVYPGAHEHPGLPFTMEHDPPLRHFKSLHVKSWKIVRNNFDD